MEKIEMLKKIQKLSALIHSQNFAEYAFSQETVAEMRRNLNELTLQYIAAYC